MKTCVICTGLVWLILPAAIAELNYHLALAITLVLPVKLKLTTCSILNIYTKHINLTHTERKRAVHHLLQCLPEDM